MKILWDKDVFIFFLNKMKLNFLNLTTRDETERYFKKLLINLNKKYNLSLGGYYNINIYVDKNYGIVLEGQKEEIDYLNCFTNQLEININVFENTFLYEIQDIDEFRCNSTNIYVYKDRLYLNLNENISVYELGRILEHSNIIYGKKAEEIFKKSRKLRW